MTSSFWRLEGVEPKSCLIYLRGCLCIETSTCRIASDYRDLRKYLLYMTGSRVSVNSFLPIINSLKKQKSLYKVLTPSVKLPYILTLMG